VTVPVSTDLPNAAASLPALVAQGEPFTLDDEECLTLKCITSDEWSPDAIYRDGTGRLLCCTNYNDAVHHVHTGASVEALWTVMTPASSSKRT
jgi:hypothetical protein